MTLEFGLFLLFSSFEVRWKTGDKRRGHEKKCSKRLWFEARM
jgi:hypothetical protein